MSGRDAFLPPDLPPDRVAGCLGLISDTHMPAKCRDFPPAVFDVLRNVDLIVHAGDIGELWVLDRLSALAPVVAVHGNDDTPDALRALPYQQVITLAAQRILLCHTHFPDPVEEMAWRRRPNRKRGDSLARRAALGHRAGAGIVVFGHSHIPMVARYEGVLLINPGAIAPPSPVERQRIRTVALLFIRDDGAPFAVHVDLARPTHPFEPAWWKEHDWLDGGRVVRNRFIESIVDPEFAADSGRVWDRLQNMDAELRDTYSAAILREAHRCWAGEIGRVTRAGVLGQLEADEEASPVVREQLGAWLQADSERRQEGAVS